MMSAPPSPAADPEARAELGQGINAGGGDSELGPFAMANYQFWYRVPAGPGRKHEAGVLGQFGFPAILSAGGFYRYSLVNNPQLYLGTQVAGGAIWAGISLPVALKMGERFWLTTQPSYRANPFYPHVHLPIGLSWHTSEHSRIDTELGAHIWALEHGWSTFTSVNDGGEMFYLGIAWSHELGPME